MLGLALSVICLFVMAYAAYVVADANGKKPWQAAIATVMIAPLFFVVLFQKSDFRTGDEDSSFVRIMKIAGTASFGVMIAIIVFGRVVTGSFTALPTCDSSYAADLAKDAIAQSPAGINLGIRIVGLIGPREIASSDYDRSCSATAMLNSGERLPAEYTLSVMDSQLYVSIQLLP